MGEVKFNVMLNLFQHPTDRCTVKGNPRIGKRLVLWYTYQRLCMWDAETSSA
jgi:hypothetical protein